MHIGLIDADLMWGKHANGRRYGKTKADIFPNLAIMKISAWHKQQGDTAEWYNGLKHYDRMVVWASHADKPLKKKGGIIDAKGSADNMIKWIKNELGV